MKALVLDRYGSADDFRIADLPAPEPAPGEVRVRVHAASINSWDWEIAKGNLYTRIASPLKPQHTVLGGDVAGVVESLGPGVTELSVGDEVFGDLTGQKWGAFAEFAVGKASELMRKPADLDFETVSTLPQAGALAHEAVRRHKLGPATDVLVVGGGGGVGTYAIQLARIAGARVTAIDSAIKLETMQRAGADIVLDRAETDLGRHAGRYDLVFDPVAAHGLRTNLRLLKSGGAFAAVGGRVGPLLQTGLLGPMLAPKQGKTAGLVIWKPNDRSELLHLIDLIRSDKLQPVIDRTYALDDGVAAMRHFASGAALGKLVITPHRD